MALSSASKTEPVRALRIWRLSDGRAGHDNQSLGLTDALARARPCDILDLPLAAGFYLRLKSLLAETRSPDLIIGAGRRTHNALLFLRLRYGGRSVVIMKPGWPKRLFDLCLIPDHDEVSQSGNILTTRGVLNRNQAGRKQAGHCLVLIGGPSKHFHWDSRQIVEQLCAVIESERYTRLKIADSPRTPEQTRAALMDLQRSYDSVEYFPFPETAPQWLSQELSVAEDAWVSQDSMSMLYEALSAGCRLGLLAVPVRRSSSRVVNASKKLLSSGDAMMLEQWQQSTCLTSASGPWAESDRCADIILKRWFSDRVNLGA